MKKLLLLIIVYLFIVPYNMNAGNSDLFYYDEQKIENEFTQLTELENYVYHNNVTLNNLLNKHNPILNKTNLYKGNSTTPLQTMFTMDNMDWASFAWGFCCWPVGCLIVPFNKNKDDNEKLSFFYGMLGSDILGGIYQIYVLIKTAN